jgi:phosphoribosylformylglycinamidine synthase
VKRERVAIDALLEAVAAACIESAHDCSDGGLAVAIAECLIGDPHRMRGADIDLAAWDALPLRAVLFGEAQGRIVVSSAQPDRVLAIAGRHGVPAARIGTVRPAAAGLTISAGGTRFHVSGERLGDAYHTAIPRIMTSTPQAVVVEETEGVVP